ncbi:hypothetical protein PspLS_06268 [Pyricularia sp. CBS 133598]|nr:hypothetical protein PspLS_06268 [Pyricularia sp. CBS 133598]
MFPLLHPQIVDAVGKDICPAWENNAQQDGPCTNDYDTNVSGQFRCSNRACFKVWSSGLVTIRIMAFDDNRYNAVVYNQHCKKMQQPRNHEARRSPLCRESILSTQKMGRCSAGNTTLSSEKWSPTYGRTLRRMHSRPLSAGKTQ